MIALNTVVHNEAHRIRGLLDHAGIFCDELVVVDQDSEDGTAEIARDFGATVLRDVCHGISEPSRPLAAEHTESDWIVYLDADETLMDAAVIALPTIMAGHPGATFARLNLIDGVRSGPKLPDGRWSPDFQFRFFRKGRVTYDLHVHGRIRPFVFGETFVGPPDPWMLHAKSRAEQDLDDARYKVLMDAS